MFNRLIVEWCLLRLRSPKASVRRRATLFLAWTRDAKAYTALFGALRDRSEEVAKAAAEGLGEFGDRRAITPLLDSMDSRYPSVFLAVEKALARLDATREQFIEGYLQTLSTTRQDAYLYPPRRLAADALHRLGAGHEQLLDGYTRALSNFGREPTRDAAVALRLLGDARAIKPLLKRLPSSHQAAHEEVKRALDELGATKDQILKAYIGGLNDKRASISLVLDALAEIGDTRAIGPLMELLENQGRANKLLVQSRIARILYILGELNEVVIRALAREPLANKDCLRKIGCSAVDPLVSALRECCKSHGFGLRFKESLVIAELLRDIGGKKADNALAEWLEFPNYTGALGELLPEVRSSARAGDSATTAALIGKANGGHLESEISEARQLLQDTPFRLLHPKRSRSRRRTIQSRLRELETKRYQDQLAAIDCLGETGSREALEFLEKLYTPTITYEDGDDYTIGWGASDTLTGHDSRETRDYTNAPLELRKRLSFSVTHIFAAPGLCNVERITSSGAHAVVRTALSRLRTEIRAN